MADPVTIGVVGGAALLLAKTLGDKPKVSEGQSGAALAQSLKQAVVTQRGVESSLVEYMSSRIARDIVIGGVAVGVTTTLGAIVAIFTGVGGPIGVVIGVAIAILAITIGGIIELVSIIADLADNSQWRAVEQYARDWQETYKVGVNRLQLWAAMSSQSFTLADQQRAATSFADGYMIRLTLQRQWFATFPVTMSGGTMAGQTGLGGQLGDWTNAWRASNSGRVYGTPIHANWQTLQNTWPKPNTVYGGGENLNLWTLPPRKGSGYDNWYQAGAEMANVSGYVMAAQMPVGFGLSYADSFGRYRACGMFQGSLRQDIGAIVPALEWNGKLWAYMLPRGIGGFQPVYLGPV